MNAPLGSDRLAEIRASVARAPHPAPGTWAAGLRDLLAEVDRLQAVLAELEAERDELSTKFDTAIGGFNASAMELVMLRDRIRVLETLTPAPVQTCRVCGAGYTYGEPCSACEFQKRMAASGHREGQLAEQRRRADVAEARVRVLEAGLAEGRPVDEDPVAFSLTPDGEAALARLNAVLAPPAGYREGQLAEQWHQLLDPAEPPLACDGPAAGGLTVYRAEHDSIVMGLYTTRQAAREHCEAEELLSWSMGTSLTFDWIEDEEDGVAELVTVDGGDKTDTGYVVTPLEIASEYDPDGDE